MPESGIYANCYKFYSKLRTFALHSSKKSAFANIVSYTNPIPLVPPVKNLGDVSVPVPHGRWL